MKVRDVLTDELVSKLAVRYSKAAEDHECDWKALKIALYVAVVETANACGVAPESALMNDDGTWSDK